jgi:hypothetical protein
VGGPRQNKSLKKLESGVSKCRDNDKDYMDVTFLNHGGIIMNPKITLAIGNQVAAL